MGIIDLLFVPLSGILFYISFLRSYVTVTRLTSTCILQILESDKSILVFGKPKFVIHDIVIEQVETPFVSEF